MSAALATPSLDDMKLFAAVAGAGLMDLGEVVCAPGVENVDFLDAVFTADLAAFRAQSPKLAARYCPQFPGAE